MRTRSAVLLVGGVGYSLIAASTTPFTQPADVLTGAVVVAMAVLVCVRWPLRTRKVRAAASSSSAAAAGAAGAASAASAAGHTPRSASGARSGHPYLPWLGLLLVLVIWEMFNYLVHGTRANHPTFSSITDAIDRTYLLKALLFLGWLALGWVILDRGARSRARARAPVEP
jgi:hypothetical protein